MTTETRIPAETSETKKPFEINPDTRLLTDALLALKPGEVMTYTAMGKLLSRKVDGKYSPLQSARRRAEKEDGFVFATERLTGVRRLTDAEIVALGETGAKSLRRQAKRMFQKTSNVADFEALPDGLKQKQLGAMALFSAVMSATKASTLRRLEAASNTGTQISLGRTFELFNKD